MLISLSKILIILVFIQSVTSVDFYKSKRVPPSYRRARLLKNKGNNDNIRLAKIIVSKNIEQENVSIGSTKSTEVENLSLITTTEKPDVSTLNEETQVLEANPELKKKRKVLVQKRRLGLKRKSGIVKDSTIVDILPETTTEVYKQYEITASQTSTEVDNQKEIVATQTSTEAYKQKEIAATQTTNEVYKQTEITTTQKTTGVYKQKQRATAQTTTEAYKQKQRAAVQTTTEAYTQKQRPTSQATTEGYKQKQRAAVQTTTEAYTQKQRPTSQATTEGYKQKQRATTQITTEAYKQKQRATTQATTEVYKHQKTAVTQTTKYQRSYDYSTTPYPVFEKSTEKPFVPIIGSENYVYAYNGDYHYSYEGGDGTKAFERGEIRAADDISGQPGVVGGYSYKDKDGNDYSLSYTAGKDGYRPVGAHLPTPPPIPPAIQRVLRILATKTTPEPVTESINKYY